ncbi:MAG: hypothetical protein ABSH20_19230 [Tepidisphaeraceae bacterium]|jgi:hypothetical protein
MTPEQAYTLCEHGQRELMRTNYLEAERLLTLVETAAWEARDYDLLARVYMPLQEARRQKRQRCGEGIVRLDIIAREHDVTGIVDQQPFGQLLVAGRAAIEPAIAVRRLARERGLYLETFLAAAYETGQGTALAVIPEEHCAVPGSQRWASEDELAAALPPGAFVLLAGELPRGPQQGDAQTYARVMALWERLHQPFLAMANGQDHPITKMAGYRRTIAVDSACELAHQKISDVARRMGMAAKSPVAG